MGSCNPELFLVGCIGLRSALTYLAYSATKRRLRTLGYVGLVVATGLLLSDRKTGLETCGKPIWWGELRPVHALLWAMFGYLAVSGNRSAWVPLAVDTVFGLTVWMRRQ